jgi:hypothetical protein
MRLNDSPVAMALTRVNDRLSATEVLSQWFTTVLLCLSSMAYGRAAPAKVQPQATRATPASSQSSAATVQPTTPNGTQVQALPAAAPAYVEVDTWTERLGGDLFSTGADDVIVRIRGEQDFQPASSIGDRRLLPSPWTSGIYLVSPGPVRYIGSNREGGKELNLGKLAPGELIFAVTTTDGYTLRTGDASRNIDGLFHAITRTYRSGIIEVWFEDAPGPLHWRGGRSDRNFTDAVIQLRGGVSDTRAVADLLKVIKEQHGEARQAAVEALKKINPKAAAMAGVP